MTFSPIGTFMQLLRLVGAGSPGALGALPAFDGGVGLLIASAIAGYDLGVVAGGVLFAVGFAGSRPPT